jgi:2-keto-4-pentenoate hydratase/2-oxohepta-3-ene-1,7-dioic acid hydratase in catechol pathway
MTAEDLLRRNLRYIARSKGFDTFFSLGPYLVIADELTDLSEVRVTTSINGSTVAEAPLSWMIYDVMWLVSHHSTMCRLQVGDILSTGTPGAGVIRDGDRVEASVSGIGRLENSVRDAPKQ